MRKTLVLFVFLFSLILVGATQNVSAQVSTPAKGTAERKAIYDGVRKYRKNADEVYSPDSLYVQTGWAFTVIPDPNEPEVDTLRLHLLLKKSGKTWKVVGAMEVKEGETWGQAVKRLRKKFPSAPSAIFK